jgi:DNA-binding transcriptional LysR family regulator
MRDEMRSLRFGLSGNLRLGVIPTAMPMVADLTSPFIARHPNVRVTVFSRSSAEIIQGLEELSIDAGITYLDNEPLGRVTKAPLYSEFYCLFVAKDHPLASAPQVSWAGLSGLNLCLLTDDMQNRRIINQHLSEAGLDLAPTIESNSTIVLIAHVLTGKWASILPRKLANLFSDTGAARAIPIVTPEVEHLVGLVAAHRDPPTPLIAELLDAARKLGRRKA